MTQVFYLFRLTVDWPTNWLFIFLRDIITVTKPFTLFADIELIHRQYVDNTATITIA